MTDTNETVAIEPEAELDTRTEVELLRFQIQEEKERIAREQTEASEEYAQNQLLVERNKLRAELAALQGVPVPEIKLPEGTVVDGETKYDFVKPPTGFPEGTIDIGAHQMAGTLDEALAKGAPVTDEPTTAAVVEVPDDEAAAAAAAAKQKALDDAAAAENAADSADATGDGLLGTDSTNPTPTNRFGRG
jgi:hypothetical protein